MLMCENVKIDEIAQYCPYPFDQPSANSFIVKDNSIPKNEKSDKEKYVRSHESASGINTTTPKTVPGAFFLKETIESLLLNAGVQENLDIFTITEIPNTDADIQYDNNFNITTSPDQANTVPETSNYSLQDIEQLLQDDNMMSIQSDFDTSSVQDLEQFFTSDSISPEGTEYIPLQQNVVDERALLWNSSEDGQPEQSCVNTPIDDQSGLFNGLDQILSDNWNKDCDPFSTELDSLLGI
ncbi:hypothetical protein INT45_007627 [Circinella minor]|uniref:Uncharacterized protein n=1 Tax=Circinella minor TaxID=1195481 RepID=A0A8H7VFS7_9FUNG|nr:hypothetical protein INT45_007627 [Circinella minor]